MWKLPVAELWYTGGGVVEFYTSRSLRTYEAPSDPLDAKVVRIHVFFHEETVRYFTIPVVGNRETYQYIFFHTGKQK